MLNLFKKKPSNKNTKNIKLKISGMHCTSCSLNIDGELEDLDGVVSASTSYAKSELKVEHDPEKVSEKEIKKTVEGLGYEAEKV